MHGIQYVEREYDLEIAENVKKAHRIFDSFEEKIYFIDGVDPKEETITISNPLELKPRNKKKFKFEFDNYSPTDEDRFYPVKLKGMKR